MRIDRFHTGCSVAGLTLALATSAGLAQQAVEPVLLIEHADASAWMQSEHDAGLARAFGMLPARLAELPREIDDLGPDEVGMIQLACLRRRSTGLSRRCSSTCLRSVRLMRRTARLCRRRASGSQV